MLDKFILENGEGKCLGDMLKKNFHSRMGRGKP